MMGEYDAGYENYIDGLHREIEKLQEQLESIVGRSYRTADKTACLEAENAELRELCAIVIDDWMSKVCPTFPFCECGGEYQDCADETCGNQIYRQMARELGVEVDA